MYKHIIRPILFTLQPETIHGIVVSLLKIGFKVPFLKSILRSFYAVDSPKLQRNVFGFEFKNPVGFAAGFDKNAEFFNELECFGFSFVEIGTVTPKPQPGNQKPRSFRLKKDSALINRMGFNNKGVIRVKSNLEKKKKKLVIGGNIGKNTITPNNIAVEDYVQCFTELYHFVDYFVVNISCPNIANLKELQEKENQRKILLALVKLRKKQNQYKPILLKVSPDLSELQLSDSIEIAQEVGIDGFVATNTTISREGLMSQPDEVIGMVCVEENEAMDILVVSEKGYGKRSDLDDYRVTNRGGKGVKTINITEKTGKLIAVKGVNNADDLMIINRSGITIRLSVDKVRLAGRATQGVRLINLRNGDSIAAVAKVQKDEEETNQNEADSFVSEESHDITPE